MNLLPVELHPEAETEARDARRWYAERDARAAAGFVNALDHAVDLIAEAPHRWPIYLHGTRRVLTRRYPFALVYRVLAGRRRRSPAQTPRLLAVPLIMSQLRAARAGVLSGHQRDGA